jgi:hypothetical protein
VARGCGYLRTATVDTLDNLRARVTEAMADRTTAWTIVARIESGDSPHRPSKNCVSLRDRFMAGLAPQGD